MNNQLICINTISPWRLHICQRNSSGKFSDFLYIGFTQDHTTGQINKIKGGNRAYQACNWLVEIFSTIKLQIAKHIK